MANAGIPFGKVTAKQMTSKIASKNMGAKMKNVTSKGDRAKGMKTFRSAGGGGG